MFRGTLDVTFDMLIVAEVDWFAARFTVVFEATRSIFIGDVFDIVPFSVTLEFCVTTGMIVVVVEVVDVVDVLTVDVVVHVPPEHIEVVGTVDDVVLVDVDVVVVGIVVVVVDLDVVDFDVVEVEADVVLVVDRIE